MIILDDNLLQDLFNKRRIFYLGVNAQNSVKGIYDLIQYIKEYIELNLVVEIGSFAGVSTELFALYFKNVISVDIWERAISENNYTDIRLPYMSAGRYEFGKVLTKYSNVKLIEDFSVSAAKQCNDESIDVVYIDGDHKYAQVFADIEAWRAKVKKGGFMSGHDYSNHSNIGVKKAVDEIFGKPQMVFNDTSWCVRVK